MRQLLIFLLLATSTLALAKPVTCEDPVTGDPVRVTVPQIKRALKAVRKAMQKRGVHVVDLPDDVQARRRRLPEDMAAKDWCVVRSHVIAFEDALAMSQVDEGFVSQKFSRIERWVRVADAGKRKTGVDRQVANAAAFLADGRYDKANVALNRVLGMLFGSKDTWEMPDTSLITESDDDAAQASKAKVSSRDVEAGCPTLAKKGRASREDMQNVFKRLARLMDKRQVRPIDLEGGDTLVGDLQSYVNLGAVWPATRTACAMLNLVKELQIDLGTVQKRFLHVTKLRGERGIPAQGEVRFKELVRAASDHMSRQEWSDAHLALEELLVLMGELESPSSALP